MSTHRIHVFVSHSWTYSGHYETLQQWIFGQRWRYGQASLRFSDYSVPKDDPIHDAPTAAALMAAILKKMVRCHVVIVPTGMYATHSVWIGKEIDSAMARGKPIPDLVGDLREQPARTTHADNLATAVSADTEDAALGVGESADPLQVLVTPGRFPLDVL